MSLPVYIIDAFTSRAPFTGNPAAVVPLERWIPDATMQSIAAQHNLAETAFFVPDSSAPDLFHLRWFTPASEINLCGHATLATGHLVLNEQRARTGTIRFQTKSGILTVAPAEGRLTLDFPALPARPVDLIDRAAAALGGARPAATLKATFLMAVFDRPDQIRALRPNMPLITDLDDHGVIATAPGAAPSDPHARPPAIANTGASAADAFDFISRCFVPRFGVPEDPVTGSAHCTLIPYWSQRLGRTTLHALQASPRTGELWCENDAKTGRVRMSGHARVYLRGEIAL